MKKINLNIDLEYAILADNIWKNILKYFQKPKFATVVILVAMEDEAKPLLKKLKQASEKKVFKFQKLFPRIIFLKTFGKDSTGRKGVDNVGITPAAARTMEMILRYNPDLIINAGTCGGFASCRSEIGQVYFGREIAFWDRNIPVPGFEKYGPGNYEGSKITWGLGKRYGIQTAKVLTGNSFFAPEAMKTLGSLTPQNSILVDMESASIMQIASWYGKPVICIKAVTDLIDSPTKGGPQVFLKNMELASNNLVDVVMRVLSELP